MQLGSVVKSTATVGRIWFRLVEVRPAVLLAKLWNRWPFKA